jgi:RNA polymerase sigma-70 factor, ECF subfamily
VLQLENRVREHLSVGDPAAAATVAIERLGPEILGFLRSVLKDEADASDAFSLFAEWVWRGLPDFQGGSSLRTWAYRVAWSAAGRFTRDPWRARRERLPSSAASRLAAAIRGSTAIAQDAQRAALVRLREKLTPEERTLLVLRLDRELSWTEVAEVLSLDGAPGLQEPALRKKFERLKAKLGKLAREDGLLE